MGIYTGVDGVRRQVPTGKVGADGVVRDIKYGFNGVNGVRRQFFGPLEDVARVELRVVRLYIDEVDSSGNMGANIYSGDNAAEAKKYGAITITDSAISAQGRVDGKMIEIAGNAWAVFEDGRQVPLRYLSESGAKYGAAISFPIRYSISFSSYTYGQYIVAFADEPLHSDYVSGAASGTKTFSAISADGFWLGAGRTSGSGSVIAQMGVTNITIDGRSVPVQVVSQLIEEETT